MARKHRRKTESAIDVTLPITPMLDMSFQLLSFFILTFHPMPTEGQLSVNLPKIDASEKAETDPSPPEDKKDEYTLTIIANSSGEVGLLALKGPTVNAENIKDFANLLVQLKNIPKPAGRGAEGVSITIEASNDVTYGKLVQVMDLCKTAGYESVNLSPTKGGR